MDQASGEARQEVNQQATVVPSAGYCKVRRGAAGGVSTQVACRSSRQFFKIRSFSHTSKSRKNFTLFYLKTYLTDYNQLLLAMYELYINNEPIHLRSKKTICVQQL